MDCGGLMELRGRERGQARWVFAKVTAVGMEGAWLLLAFWLGFTILSSLGEGREKPQERDGFRQCRRRESGEDGKEASEPALEPGSVV